MKKTIIIGVICVIMIMLSAGLLTGCSVDINHEDAYKMLIANYAASIEYDIFYSKELKSNNVNKEIMRVNSVCTLNKNNDYAKDTDGSYKDHAVHVYNEKDGEMQYEIMVGLSKDGKKDAGKYLKFNTVFTGKNEKKESLYDRTYTTLTPWEYIDSQDYEPNKLSNKLAEIGNLQFKDIVFDPKIGAVKTGELTNLKFKLTDDYYEMYRNEKGVDSILKGTYIMMELLYGRIANITVMQEEKGTESIFGLSEYESYKFEIVYLGPKIQNIPNYNAKDKNKVNIWKEIK